ncbi:hypothetical protein RND71_010042 [Anisodus tanguticus]|uniref:Uncharacterized protein n=1 Tax=Anisodus tanguticus TaxID=243964 RepID=A0AAE1VIS7_9SOLA|nr:hypothetical protein RND71_010042 [Anisodus tanguticus]
MDTCPAGSSKMDTCPAGSSINDMNKRTAVDCPRRDSQSLRYFDLVYQLNCSNKSHHLNSIDWTFCSPSVADATTSDVVAPLSWTIFGCQNGLRLFKEARDRESHRKWDDHPANTHVTWSFKIGLEKMSITRMFIGEYLQKDVYRWGFCHYKGSVIEHLDGHTDIVHKLLCPDWLPWTMKKKRSSFVALLKEGGRRNICYSIPFCVSSEVSMPEGLCSCVP